MAQATWLVLWNRATSPPAARSAVRVVERSKSEAKIAWVRSDGRMQLVSYPILSGLTSQKETGCWSPQVDIMWRMPLDFISHVFHVYFSHGLLVYLFTCISGGHNVMFEPRFPFDVYSTWVFSCGSLVYISMRITRDFVRVDKWWTGNIIRPTLLCVCWCCLPSRHQTLNQCCFVVGSPSSTLTHY